MFDRNSIRTEIAEHLGIDPHEIDWDDDLLLHGLHSLAIIRFSERWTALGRAVGFGALAAQPTVAAWESLLAAEGTEPVAPAPEAAASDDEVEFGLAPMQHAYWAGRQSGQALGGVAAHLYAEFDGGDLDPDRLDRAVRSLLHRHPMLRAAFTAEATQWIAPAPEGAVVEVHDLRGEAVDAEAELARLREEKTHQMLDVEAGRVIDVAVSLRPGERARLHVDVDMLAADAQSYRRILEDLALAYETDEPLGDPAEPGYREYLAATAHRPGRERARAWWAERLDTLPGAPALPTVREADRPEPRRSIRLDHVLDEEAAEQLARRARHDGTTASVVLATAFAEVVARWSAQKRFVLNVPLFHRAATHRGVDDLVGDFTDSVLLAVDCTEPAGFTDRARALQSSLHAAIDHSDHSGLDVLRDLGRRAGDPVLAPIVFTSGLNLGRLFSERVLRVLGRPAWIISQGPQVDLDVQVVDVDGGVLVNWDVRRDAFPPGVVEDMFRAFLDLVDDVLAGVERLPVALPASHRERRRRSELPATAPRTLHHRFFDLAAREPDRVAVRGDGVRLSYGALAHAALSLAARLEEAGVRPGDAVAISVPRGPDQVVAVLGVLAAGASYVPVGIEDPAARRDRILARAGADVVVGAVTAPCRARVLPVAGSAQPLDAPRDCAPDAIAYVLFTSGSTGEPKGVEVSHAAAANTIDAIGAHFALGSDERTIALSSLQFDLSVYDLVAPLSSGGSVVVLDPDAARDAYAWAELIAAHGVSVVNAAPALLRMLLDAADDTELSSIRTVVTGGDWVPTATGLEFVSRVPGVRFAGLGGTTETAIHSTVHEVSTDAREATVPYGRPLAGVRCRVVDERGDDCPDWVLGELWIGGASVADGYRGDPERTADRFVLHEGVRWYRTGDLARYRGDGDLEFHGRRDHQVKLRGYRIELGEVESALLRLDGVDRAVAVLLAQRSGVLAAAVVPASGVALAADEVRAALAHDLPGYMVPEVVLVLDELPLTPNGKIDRVALAARATASASGATHTEATPVETAIGLLMAAVLEADPLAPEDDFFRSGGDSVTAVACVAAIRAELRVEDVSVVDLLTLRTPRALADALTAREADDLPLIAEILVDVLLSAEEDADVVA